MKNQSKDAFPSDTKKNPKDCIVVTLRSGREFENIKEDEKRKIEKKKSKHKLKKKSSSVIHKRRKREERKRCSKNNQ